MQIIKEKTDKQSIEEKGRQISKTLERERERWEKCKAKMRKKT